MNYATVKKFDIANGIGVRVSLFVSGCTHSCKGCFNEEARDFSFGQSFDKEIEEELLEALEPRYIRGLSLLGGEPFEKANQTALADFVERVRNKYPEKDIWCYTGYLFDTDLVPGGRAYCDATDRLLKNIDVLVDGPFVLEKKNISLKFRGSENQRIIDVKKSLLAGETVLWEEEK